MILRSNFGETPTVKEWGKKFIVPIGIKESTTLDSEGNEVPLFSADIINEVETLSVAGIVKAAIAAEFSQADVDYVMLNVGNAADPKVKAYTDFVAEVTAKAQEAGYK